MSDDGVSRHEPPRGRRLRFVLPAALLAVALGLMLVGAVAVLAAGSRPGYGFLGDGERPVEGFEADRAEFDVVVAQLPPAAGRGGGDAEGWEPLDVPSRIGGYLITPGDRLDDGAVILYRSDGPLLDDAGFACLPDGPKPEYDTGWFEEPEWHPLIG